MRLSSAIDRLGICSGSRSAPSLKDLQWLLLFKFTAGLSTHRMASGNLGDVKSVGKGVWKAQIDWGTWLQSLFRASWQAADFAALWR